MIDYLSIYVIQTKYILFKKSIVNVLYRLNNTKIIFVWKYLGKSFVSIHKVIFCNFLNLEIINSEGKKHIYITEKRKKKLERRTSLWSHYQTRRHVFQSILLSHIMTLLSRQKKPQKPFSSLLYLPPKILSFSGKIHRFVVISPF